jgi:D-amino-acid dehydrogenase
MRIAIVGAGIVGVTTAYELSQDGHEVTVLEHHPGVACGTSFANAGVLAPGYVTPWAAPGVPWKVLAGLLSRHAAVRFGPRWPLALPWLARFLRACNANTYARHRQALYALASLSQERLADIQQRLALADERAPGYLVLVRSARELQRCRSGLAVLDSLGVRYRILDQAGCRLVEPGLAHSAPLHGGIHLPDAAVANCRLYAQGLRQHLARQGVRFRFETQVLGVQPGASVRLTVRAAGDATALEADRVVFCTGPDAQRLLRPLGLRLRLEPVWGYTLTARLRHEDLPEDAGPRAGLMDERYKVALSRLGQRVRVAGSAEVGGVAGRLHGASVATLHKVLEDWFPGQIDRGSVQYWKGARPMRPDGPPVIGATGVPGVWVNLGHGSSGWALACGSARLLADQLAGRPCPIDVRPFDAQGMR